MSHDYSEDTLIEQPAIALFAELGYETVNCFRESFGESGTLGRETSAEVVLVRQLRAVLKKLNPRVPREAINLAVEEIARDRSILAPVRANQEVYKLLKDGVKVTFKDDEDEEVDETVKIIDWDNPDNNDFFLASQLWISGEMYKRRADLVGFVNGIPLVFIELKAAHRRLENAYSDNLRDYKNTIPQLFWYNAFIILSNGSQSKIGSSTAAYEHFAEWKKINSEGEEGIISLETMIRGTCEKSRLLDIVENFTLFSDAKGGLNKIVCKNHQFLGVNNAIQAVHDIEDNKGRLGVFWHTQGSGKSYSMTFFSQKILRKIPGNWTFLIVTDRVELDKQIYKGYASVGAVTEQNIQAKSGEHLKQLLKEDHRYVFTLIHKFHTEKGMKYEMISDRSDIIVITDEAHRSQYDTMALNMRNALPNASFIGFTGTPLMAGEEKTREVFGDYVSIYNFRQSIEDGATVPLYYENRIPELQLTNDDLNTDLENIVENAALDEDQEKKLEREFAREYHLITRDDRLEKVAEDIVDHFMGRGYQGKAMMVSIDKVTAVRMYDKVQKYWKSYLEKLREGLFHCPEEEKEELLQKIKYMEETDMAVVVSQSQNEIEDFHKKGLDILPHRTRMIREDLETEFKDPSKTLRMVFVCAMWMTGFDVPSISTLYVDKPMRNHTLMQTIARANRVFKGKNNGLIVDYIGVFRDMQKALAIYGAAEGGNVDPPIKNKQKLIEDLKKAIAETTDFCAERGVTVQTILDAQGFEKVRLLDDAVEGILVNDDSKKKYFSLTGNVTKLYKAILPDQDANEFAAIKTLFVVIADKIRSLTPNPDISEVMGDIEEVLDRSIATEGYVIHEDIPLVDLSQIDFKALKEHFEKGRKKTQAEQLKGAVSTKLKKMVRLNKNRMDYLEKFQKMIDEYNSGSMNIELFFDKLLVFVQDLNEEDKRGISENLTEEELALFDMLTKPDIPLTGKDKKEVKKVAKELLHILKEEKLVLDWRKRQQTRAQVLITIQDMLDRRLPRSYSNELYDKKCTEVYQHFYDSYYGQGRSIYETA